MSWDFRKPGTRICVCYNVTNDQALALWQSAAAPNVQDLTTAHHCGQNCAMCIPYFQTLLDEYRRGEWPEGAKTNTPWFGAKHG